MPRKRSQSGAAGGPIEELGRPVSEHGLSDSNDLEKICLDHQIKERKKNVDIISQKVGGDMTLFAGEIRKTYENDPTYQDKVLGDMTGVFKQDVSGVFTGQSLVG